MTNEYRLFNITFVRHLVYYLNKEIEAETIIPTPILKFNTMANQYRLINDYTPEERDHIIELGATEKFKEITNNEISYLIMVVEMTRLYIEEIPKKKRFPCLNVSDDKLRGGFREYTMGMLRLKKANPEDYTDKKEIMDNSRTMARELFWYLLTNLKGKEL